jgi:hypothetical protein
MAQATHSFAGTPQHGQPAPRAKAGDGPIELKAPVHSAQIAKVKRGASLALVNPIFTTAMSSAIMPSHGKARSR